MIELRLRVRLLLLTMIAMGCGLALWRFGSPPQAAPPPIAAAGTAQARRAAPAAAAPVPAPAPAPARARAPAGIAGPDAGASIPPAPPAHDAASPPTTPAPATPARVTAVADPASVHDVVWSAVPSVTSDGALILVPIQDPDGARGLPNLRFDLWNRSGKLVKQLVVQTVDPCDGPGCPPDSAAQVAARERAAAQLLDDLQRKGLQPLQAGSEPDGEKTHAAYTAAGDRAPSLTIELSPEGRLTVKPKGRAAITRRNPLWRTAPTPARAREMQAKWNQGLDACFNPAELRAPQVDLARRVAVVTIGYHGNDTCWEPGPDYTVVTW